MYSVLFRSGSSGSFFSVGRMGRSGSFWVLLVVFRYSEFEGISALLSKNVNKLSRFFRLVGIPVISNFKHCFQNVTWHV